MCPPSVSSLAAKRPPRNVAKSRSADAPRLDVSALSVKGGNAANTPAVYVHPPSVFTSML